MPPARKRGSQEQGRQLQAYTACRCCGGCRRRRMTTTSLHGSSSFVALNKRKGSTPSRNCKRQMTTTSLHGSSSSVALKKGKKKPTPSRNCKRGGGLSSSSSWVQTEADDDNKPTWLVVVRCFKEREEETHPVSQLQARGWVVLGRKKPTPACSCMQGGGFLSSVLHCHCQ